LKQVQKYRYANSDKNKFHHPPQSQKMSRYSLNMKRL